MLGWHISVYRQADGGHAPAKADSPQGQQIAVWQTGLNGLKWIDALVRAGDAVRLLDGGYPTMFTARAEHLLGPIREGPPEANEVWASDSGDVLTEKWVGRTAIDRAAMAACSDDEWLLVEVWDES